MATSTVADSVRLDHRYELYQGLFIRSPQIYQEARVAADEIGIPTSMRGKVGLSGSVSSCYALLRADAQHAICSARNGACFA